MRARWTALSVLAKALVIGGVCIVLLLFAGVISLGSLALGSLQSTAQASTPTPVAALPTAAPAAPLQAENTAYITQEQLETWGNNLLSKLQPAEESAEHAEAAPSPEPDTEAAAFDEAPSGQVHNLGPIDAPAENPSVGGESAQLVVDPSAVAQSGDMKLEAANSEDAKMFNAAVEAQAQPVDPAGAYYNAMQAYWDQFALPTIPVVQYPDPPYFADGDIIEVASFALEEFGPKRSVFPRVLRGGCYNDAHGRKELEANIWAAAVADFNPDNEGSVYTFPGGNGENGAWAYLLTVESDDPQWLQAGQYPNVSYIRQRIEDSRAVLQLDAMMVANIVDVRNVGVRHLTKVPGQISVVLCDGVTSGSVALAFAIDDQFVHNFTVSAANTVPAVMVHGNSGAPAMVRYFNGNGDEVANQEAELSWLNGDLTVEVPTNGAFVVIETLVNGDNPNANTEITFNMGGQQCPDLPGKNFVGLSCGAPQGGK